MIIFKKKSFVGKGYDKDNMYLVGLSKNATISTYIVDGLCYFWHYRLRHISDKIMDRMISHKLVSKTNFKLTTNDYECCAQVELLRLISNQ